LRGAEPPHALAALRIVVPAVILLSPELREGVRAASLDRALWIVPEGLHAFVDMVPVGPALATGVEVVTVFAALLAIAGVRARPALAVLAVGAFYLFSLAQLTGSVLHDMHLLWFSALLAASPCDHAWAFDARGATEVRRSYAVPLGFARALLGCVYVFPGIHKLGAQGLSWALSDNLRNQLYWKWAEHGEVPSLRLDHAPWLLKGGGLFVLGFELLAPILFLVPRTRVVGAILGVAFHLSAQAVFRIPFLSLWACYVVLVDVRPVEAWLRELVRRPAKEGASVRPERSSVPSWVVGALLLAGVIVQGARGQTQSYPFACYPTFEHDPGTELPDLRLVATFADGTEREVVHARDAAGRRTQRQWGVVWGLAGVTAPRSEARLRAYYTLLAKAEPQATALRGAISVRFLRAYRSVRPEERDAPPVSEVELLRFTP
jgi:hypothetical protein